jgi:hypothetical protein
LYSDLQTTLFALYILPKIFAFKGFLLIGSYRDINFVVMDYLVSEGYPRAAERFAKEANIQLPFEEESIQSRVEIRRAIHAGDIETAITKINDLNPQVCIQHFSSHPLAGLNSVSCTTHNFP